MLKSWRLRNFKSFGNQPDLKLSAINVLAGANSSGKSSIIQSILLLKQTLQYGSENRSIALNGPLLRLGSFENVLNYESENKIIELGLEIELDAKDHRSYPLSPWIAAFNRFRFQPDASNVRSVSLDLKWQQAADELLPLDGDLATQALRVPRLLSTCMSMTRGTASAETDVLNVKFDFNDNHTADTEEPFSGYRAFSVSLDKTTAEALEEGKPEAKVVGGFLSYFMPSWVAVRYNATARQAFKVADGLCNPSPTLLYAQTIEAEEIPSEVVDHINEWLVINNQAPVDVTDEGETLVKNLKSAIRRAATGEDKGLLGSLLTTTLGLEKIPALSKLRNEIAELMMALDSPADYQIEPEQPRSSSEARTFLSEYFKHGVRYLGPLRDSPRHVYQLEALESTTDVGYRGEHTAAVLDLNHSKRMTYLEAPNADDGPEQTLTFNQTTGSLREAVVGWLAYLGVARDVRTRDVGVFGHQLRVSTYNEGRLQDLTNVGVGVSQVLPIVVMALLAHKGSLLIFEQPELHLHPKVQARLADFFIALAQDGKQIFLETHSEYLIDRLRLRIAQENGDDIRPLINILFSEKTGGQTRLLPIEVSEYGAVVNWPKDFFDQSQSDGNSIIRAAAEKRRKLRKS